MSDKPVLDSMAGRLYKNTNKIVFTYKTDSYSIIKRTNSGDKQKVYKSLFCVINYPISFSVTIFCRLRIEKKQYFFLTKQLF